MKYEDFVAKLKEYQAEYALEDAVYFKALNLLKDVQKDVAHLDTEQHVLRVIKPFLFIWGNMGRVFGKAFVWEKLGEVLRGLKPQFDVLYGTSFLTIDFADRANRDAIIKIYTALRQIKKVGPTGVIKIIHLLNPEIFVLWDTGIKQYYQNGNRQIDETPVGYIEFLRVMQSLLMFALRGYQNRTMEEIDRLAKAIQQEFNGKTLAKLCDEYNWVTFNLKSKK